MIKELKVDQLKSPLITAITTACGIRRVGKIEGAEIKQMADMLSKILKESFSTYTMPEVCKAIELGAYGELEEEGDPYTVSTELCYKWSMRYHDRFTKEAKFKQSQFEVKEAKEQEIKDQEQNREKWEATIVKIYNDFPIGFKNKNKGSLAWIYRYLDKKGLIKLTEPIKWGIYNQIIRIKERAKNLNKLPEGLSLPDNFAITPIHLAEYRALMQVFADWKEMEIDLQEELKNAKPEEAKI